MTMKGFMKLLFEKGKSKKLTLIILGVLFVLLIIYMTYRPEFTKTKRGALPELSTGDKWTFRVEHDQKTYTMTKVVIGREKIDEKSCYVENELIVSQTTPKITNVQAWIDKTTLHPVKTVSYVQIPGFPGSTTTTYSWTVITTYSYSWEKPPFPLEVGKEFDVTVRSTITSTSPWIENEEITEDLTCKIEGVENLTLPAGKFEALKWISYDNQNNIRGIKWFSKEAKTFIKKNKDENTLLEMKSFTVS